MCACIHDQAHVYVHYKTDTLTYTDICVHTDTRTLYAIIVFYMNVRLDTVLSSAHTPMRISKQVSMHVYTHVYTYANAHAYLQAPL